MNNRCKSRGVATVELAIFVPIIILALFFGLEVGRAIQARTLLINGLHNSLLLGLRTLHDKDTGSSLWGRNESNEIVMDGSVLDNMYAVLDSYVGNYELLSPTRDYLCECAPPAADKVTTPTLGKVACDDSKIVACPDTATQVFLTQTSGINFEHTFGGTIPIGPLEMTIRVR